MNEPPICLISYSWDGNAHQEWVLNLANDLRTIYGIDVLLDQYELQAGTEPLYFMETSIEQADKVLLILTPGYKAKATNRKGGVGAEYSMISHGLYTTQTTNTKFIPVLREGTSETSAPTFLQGRIYEDLRNDENYKAALLSLARVIREKPAKVKPPLGPVPDFDAQTMDPLLAELKELMDRKTINQTLDSQLESEEGVAMASVEVNSLFSIIESKVNSYNQLPDSGFRFHFERKGDACIVRWQKVAVILDWQLLYINSLRDSGLNFAKWHGLATFRPSASFHPNDQPQKLTDVVWTFDLNTAGQPIWKRGKQNKTSNELASEVFAYIISQIKEEAEKNNRFRK